MAGSSGSGLFDCLFVVGVFVVDSVDLFFLVLLLAVLGVNVDEFLLLEVRSYRTDLLNVLKHFPPPHKSHKFILNSLILNDLWSLVSYTTRSNK